MTTIKKIFTPQEFTGWHMFGVLCLFFGTIITVNMILAYNAGATWTGLVVKNTYIESQLFNRRQSEVEKQAVLGWSTKLSYENGVLKLSLLDKNAAPVTTTKLIGQIGRPVHEGRDQELVFYTNDGLYEAPTALGAGLWRVTFFAQNAEVEQWVRTIRFEISAAGEVVQ